MSYSGYVRGGLGGLEGMMYGNTCAFTGLAWVLGTRGGGQGVERAAGEGMQLSMSGCAARSVVMLNGFM